MRPSRRHPLFAVIASLGLLLTLVPGVGAAEPPELPRAGTDALARDSWIVSLVDGADAGREAPGLARAAGGRVGLVYRHALNGFQLLGSDRAAAALERSPRVASVQADGALYLMAESLPFGVKRVSAFIPGGSGAYQEGFRGSGARIAVLDTGIDLDHPDLVANLDAALGHNCIDDSLTAEDAYGHGTHVAGTAAAPLNGSGVVGVAPEARLVPVKMFTDAGSSSEAYALCALDHVIGLNADADAGNDVHVVNMSWGEQRAWGSCEADALHSAICRAADVGLILVAGSGNSATDGGSFVPAAYPEVISVSALADFDGVRGGLKGCGFVPSLGWYECDDTFAFFSNHGASVEVIAPGVAVQSTWPGGGLYVSSGTSMATPHVAGVAALMAAAAPGLSSADARAALRTSGECPNGQAADADGTPGCAGQGTWPDDPDGTPEPMIHALRAVQAVADGAPDPDPDPDPAAPSPPQGLGASATETAIELSWSAPADDGGAPVTSYTVYRGGSSGATTTPIGSTSSTSFTDETAQPGMTYWYVVTAHNSGGESDPSNEVSATISSSEPTVPPSAPALSAAAGDGVVNLSWTAPADDGGAAITGYQVYRGASSGSLALLTTVGNVLGFQDTGVANGTTYWYAVAAVNSAGSGELSNAVSATPTAPAVAPSAPRSLAAQAVGAGIKLTWQAPASDGGSPVTHYHLYRTDGTGSAVRFTASASDLMFIDKSVQRRSWYAYLVSAVNAAGESHGSNIVYLQSR